MNIQTKLTLHNITTHKRTNKKEMNNTVWNKLDKSVSTYFNKKRDNRNLDNLFED